MVWAEGLLPDRQRASVEWLGLGVLGLGAVDLREVVQARGHVGVVRSDRVLGDFERLLGYHHRAVVLALPVERHHLLVERLPRGVLWMEGGRRARKSTRLN